MHSDKPGLGRTTVRLCDHHSIRLTDEEVADARTQSLEAPEEFRENMLGHYLCVAYVGHVVRGSDIRVPKQLVQDRALAMAMSMEDRLAADSLGMDDYYKAMGTDEKGLMAELAQKAEEQLKARAVLLAIARAEGIVATGAEYDAEVERLSQNYILSKEELARQFKGSREDTSIREDISIEKASKLVTELALAQLG